MNAPDGFLIMGMPAKVVKKLTEDQIESNRESANGYLLRAQAMLYQEGANDRKWTSWPQLLSNL